MSEKVENYKWKVDVDVLEVTVGKKHRQLQEIIASTIVQAHQEANLPYDESEIKIFVRENCFIKIFYANIPFSFKIVS